MNQTEWENRRKGYFFLSLLALAGIILLILPADYFDTGQAMCVSVLLLHKECPGCGMTRAVQHLIHLDFKEAYFYNKLSFVVLPLLVYMIIWEIRNRFFVNENGVGKKKRGYKKSPSTLKADEDSGKS